MLGHDELEDRIAEKFQALIIEMMPMRFVAEARMRQRFREQKRIAKFMSDSFLEWIHASGSLSKIVRFFQNDGCSMRALGIPHSCAASCLHVLAVILNREGPRKE